MKARGSRFEARKLSYNDKQAFKTWNQIGALNLKKLIDDQILSLAIDEDTQRPFPVEVGFPCGKIKDWDGQFYCDFG